MCPLARFACERIEGSGLGGGWRWEPGRKARKNLCTKQQLGECARPSETSGCQQARRCPMSKHLAARPALDETEARQVRKLAHSAHAPADWIRLTIPRWYGERERPIEVLSQTAVWYSTGSPPVPIRWVLIRDPLATFPTQALLCTDWTLIRSKSSPGSSCAGNW